MKMSDAGKIVPGLYEIRWKDGGKSLAAVGITANGRRWLAPTNWSSISSDYRKIWLLVESVRRLKNG